MSISLEDITKVVMEKAELEAKIKKLNSEIASINQNLVNERKISDTIKEELDYIREELSIHKKACESDYVLLKKEVVNIDLIPSDELTELILGISKRMHFHMDANKINIFNESGHIDMKHISIEKELSEEFDVIGIADLRKPIQDEFDEKFSKIKDKIDNHDLIVSDLNSKIEAFKSSQIRDENEIDRLKSKISMLNSKVKERDEFAIECCKIRDNEINRLENEVKFQEERVSYVKEDMQKKLDDRDELIDEQNNIISLLKEEKNKKKGFRLFA